MPMATATRADPKTFPTTVGMVAKKPPLAAPLITAKAASGASVVDAGHMARMLKAVSSRDNMRALSGPTVSERNPHRIRPTADEKLKPARIDAPVLDDSPMERLYSGKKKGATKSGKVATAPAAKMRRKVVSLNSRLRWGGQPASRFRGPVPGRRDEGWNLPFHKRRGPDWVPLLDQPGRRQART